MKGKWFLIVGIIVMIAGVVVAYLANIPQIEYTSFAVTMFGAGLAAAALWDKRDPEKKPWLPLLALVLVGVGAFILALGGMTEQTMTTIILSVSGLISIIAGIIITGFVRKKNESV